ncbi:hypothetical protein PV08_02660 [Exophiala spinifera]|uniref:Xylanolytic transcriptional activator regulatory domain-containing protein n=1 Tax=Exophiala spinifera TaxID=91928 RepID=A0A0D2A060_9EURO|nr:uncharacterized protein PV08_02660 [Exophiala spinifera]KIW18372.1 hypothetical protein PV08_02660 [Exophiala spinifera]
MADLPEFKSLTKKFHTHPYPAISPTRPELSAKGKNVIVTGGGTGIGLGIAVAYAQAGAKSVAILGRRIDKLKEGAEVISKEATKDTKVIFGKADLSDRSQVDAALKSITDQFGKIDILVSNAGYLPTTGVLLDYDPALLMRGFELNVLTTLNILQAFVPLAGADPIVINVSTAMAHFRPVKGAGGYTITKAANLKLVDSFAWENPQIHVVNLQPGWVPTELNGYQKEATDVAELPGQFAVWLASPEAKFLKSKFVWANWDVHELLEKAEEIKTTKLLDWKLEGVAMSSEDFQRLEDRLVQLETRLQAGDRRSSDVASNDLVVIRRTDSHSEGSRMDDSSTEICQQSFLSPNRAMSMPNLQIVLPLVEQYFAHFNNMIPLFHEGRFIRGLLRWYDTPSETIPATYAAINVVLALSIWHDPIKKSADDYEFMHRCVKNAQSVLCNLVTRDQDLIGIQAILGLVMLFNAGPNPRPASTLIAIAFKLSHRLRLHTRSGNRGLDESTALERDRVFWIMYFLERGMNVRLRDPYLQQDDDMDVALPAFNDINDRVSIVFAGDGITWLNLLLCRVDLARIQAQVYHTLYSVRAERFSPDERQAALADLDATVREWKDSIPVQFRPDMLSETEFGSNVRFLVHLHFIYYHLFYLAHGIYAHDSEWILRIINYSDKYSGRQSRIIESSAQGDLLPSTWLEDVETARECMRLFKVVDERDMALLGQITCVYLTSMIILLTNKLAIWELPISSQMESDDALIEGGLLFLAAIAGVLEDDSLRCLWNGCVEMKFRAEIAAMSYNNAGHLHFPESYNRARQSSRSMSALFDAFATSDIKSRNGYGSNMWPQAVASFVDIEEASAV